MSRTVHMIRRYFWWIRVFLDVQHYISTYKLCAQFLPDRVLTKLMHLDIPNVPFTGCAVDSIGMLPTITKGHKFALTFICLLPFYVIEAPLKTKTAEEVTVAYLKKYYQKYHITYTFYRIAAPNSKNDILISTFESLGIKRIYSNSFYPKGNGRIENVHNFLKRTIAKFMHNGTLEWDNALPLAIYCFNVAPLVNDLEPPFYLVHGRDPLEGRLSHLQNYCRYVREQPGRLAVQEIRKMWKTHVKLL